MPFNDLKDLCNKIIGTWYCEEITECFTFHLNESMFHTESKLTIINKTSNFKPFDAFYGVGVYLGGVIPKDHTDFYIDIGKFNFNKRYHKIEEITKEKLILREYWMIPNIPPSELTRTYRRITDLSAADDILKGLGLV